MTTETRFQEVELKKYSIYEIEMVSHEVEAFGLTRWDVRDELELRNAKIAKEMEKKKKQIKKLQKELEMLEQENNIISKIYQTVI